MNRQAWRRWQAVRLSELGPVFCSGRKTCPARVRQVAGLLTTAAMSVLLVPAAAQEPMPRPPFPGGPGGMMTPMLEVVKQFDKDGDGRLNDEERQAAREHVKKERTSRRGPGGRMPGMGVTEPGKPGPQVKPADVKNYPDADLYDPKVLRTIFIDFDNKEWEAELADFYRTDVDVPATLTVDGKVYNNVGVHFRGTSSFFTVPAGSKRSLNLALDYADPKQRLYGRKTLNLLNSHSDPSFLTTVLYSRIARSYMPAPQANLVKVVINGESWGIFINAEQFNKEFLAANFKSSKGARWKSKGNPAGGGGLDYIGDRIEDYKRRYEIKSEDNEKDWQALITLCKTLSNTPIEKLEAELKPMLNIDGVLWFLALDTVLVNNDGYWVRASDFNLFRDQKGVFYIFPHDVNESFQATAGFGFGPRPGGPGGPGPGGGRLSGIELDPLNGLNDAKKPLRSRLLAIPHLKTRYLEYVRTIAREWLDWKKLGPIVADLRNLIDKEIQADTRKLTSYEAFKRATADALPEREDLPAGRRPSVSLRAFAEQRQKFLLSHAEIKKLDDGPAENAVPGDTPKKAAGP